MNTKTATEVKGHYEPLPTQIITIDSKKYAYNFERLNFAQVMMAEERTQLRMDRRNYLEDNPQVLERDNDPDYISQMAAILFVPMEGKKILAFDKDEIQSVQTAIENAPAKNFTVVEAVITDFFTRRGKRGIALEMLGKNRSAKKTLQLMAQIASSTKFLKPNSSSIRENSAVELASESLERL